MSKDLAIMISSTRKDLMQYRESASEVIEKLRKDYQGRWAIREVSMEDAVQTGKRERPVAKSKEWVEQADLFVMIVGWHYGTITDEEGANGLGVTEWEYRHAQQMGKPSYVFLAGEYGTADSYMPDARVEKVNLPMAALDAPDDERGKMAKFRCLLAKKHASFFQNLNDFRDRLERTLRMAIEEKSEKAGRGKVDPASALAVLILAVQVPIADCAASVTVLKSYKIIHDALHTIRHEVLKKIREGLLSDWSSASELTLTNERRISKLSSRTAELLKTVRDHRSVVGDTAPMDLTIALTALDAYQPLWNPPDDETTPSAADFIERLDDFAQYLQDAFTRANAAMQAQSSIFDSLHKALEKAIQQKRYAGALQADEIARLDEELNELRSNADRLAETLAHHDGWQRLHDALESANRSGEMRQRRLRQFSNVQLAVLRKLTEACPTVLKPFGDTRLSATVDLLERAIDLWIDPLSEDQSGAFLAAFDDCFFEVDRATLSLVKAASDRANGFSVLLEELRRKRNGGLAQGQEGAVQP